MPTYEYVCKQCGENFDVFQSFSAKPLKKHDACGGELQKVFHARGIVFKGSGFYATDSKGKTSGGSTSEKKEKDTTPSKGSDTKTADKAPAKSGTDSKT